MKNIAWTGRSDARLLTADDLKKGGVETNKDFIFPRHTAVSVSNEVAEAILNNARLFGSFTESQVDEGEQLDFSTLDSTTEDAGAPVDTPQTGTDAPAPKKGARSSTANQ